MIIRPYGPVRLFDLYLVELFFAISFAYTPIGFSFHKFKTVFCRLGTIVLYFTPLFV